MNEMDVCQFYLTRVTRILSRINDYIFSNVKCVYTCIYVYDSMTLRDKRIYMYVKAKRLSASLMMIKMFTYMLCT